MEFVISDISGDFLTSVTIVADSVEQGHEWAASHAASLGFPGVICVSPRYPLVCCNCGTRTEPLVSYHQYAGGHGSVVVVCCDDRSACWERERSQ